MQSMDWRINWRRTVFGIAFAKWMSTTWSCTSMLARNSGKFPTGGGVWTLLSRRTFSLLIHDSSTLSATKPQGLQGACRSGRNRARAWTLIMKVCSIVPSVSSRGCVPYEVQSFDLELISIKMRRREHAWYQAPASLLSESILFSFLNAQLTTCRMQCLVNRCFFQSMPSDDASWCRAGDQNCCWCSIGEPTKSFFHFQSCLFHVPLTVSDAWQPFRG